jgi:uncharacterized protein YbgA (DUF1722 family)/uncharacterized protein YbbK (DUF523 family)
MAEIRIGVSSCLLGREVRFDGGHKRHGFIVDTLGPFVQFVPVCPEVELGLGTPRETLRLVRPAGDDAVRLIMANGHDHTDAMRRYAKRRVEALARENLAGYILKKDSPSCGMERVKVYRAPKRTGADPVPEKNGRGLFAEALLSKFPHLPVEEEGRLQDPRLRENFVERVFAWRRLQDLFGGRWTMGDLVRFHTAHKLVVLAHSTTAYRALGRLVADGRSRGRRELRDRYTADFMRALAVPATPKKHANVLQHIVGHFRGRLDTGSRDELLAAIDDHRRGIVPLVVPMTLVKHHVRRLDVPYLAGQVYLDPHPKELMLRNHV